MAPDKVAEADGTVLEVDRLVKHFAAGGGLRGRGRAGIMAVNGVSLTVRRGETFGLVGESGCGKSTAARAITGLLRPDAGRVVFLGEDMVLARRRRIAQLRQKMQMVFQDPTGSLNPQMSVRAIVAEGLRIHRRVRRREEAARVAELLDLVGLRPDFMHRFPYQLSGGQRQRVGIARALSLEPELLILDEPLSALDVSIQAQILKLLRDLQVRLGLSYLLISHDLSVVRHVSHRIAVMYLGRIVETGPAERVFASPEHPYTRALLSAVPLPDPAQRDRTDVIVLEGDPPSPAAPPSGCTFRTRCWKADAHCAEEVPALQQNRDRAHLTACFHPDLEADTLVRGQTT